MDGGGRAPMSVQAPAPAPAEDSETEVELGGHWVGRER